MAVSLEITYEGLNEAIDKIGNLKNLDKSSLLDALGGIVVSQTQRRITSEKTAPDGSAWKPNFQGTSTLFREGNLAGSITHNVGSDTVEIGSNLVYAAIHQFGGTIKPKNASKLMFTVGANRQPVFADQVTIPARAYLGLSEGNKSEAVEAIENWIAELLQ